MKYIYKIDDSFGFKDDSVNVILESDTILSDDIYNKFFEMQGQGKEYKLLNINGNGFEEMFEEIIKGISPAVPSMDDRLSAMESVISAIMGVD